MNTNTELSIVELLNISGGGDGSRFAYELGRMLFDPPGLYVIDLYRDYLDGKRDAYHK